MIAYLDSSVLLRIVLGQGNALKEWQGIEQGIASALLEVESLRTLDRLRLAQGLGDDEVAVRREAVFRLIEAVEVVEITPPSACEGRPTAPDFARHAGRHPSSHRFAVAGVNGGGSSDGHTR